MRPHAERGSPQLREVSQSSSEVTTQLNGRADKSHHRQLPRSRQESDAKSEIDRSGDFDTRADTTAGVSVVSYATITAKATAIAKSVKLTVNPITAIADRSRRVRLPAPVRTYTLSDE